MPDPPRIVLAYDAFVSYSRKDSAIVEEIAGRLEDIDGFYIWKDDWEVTGGDDWLDTLPEAIARSRVLLAFVGPHGLGPWHKEEIKIALRRAVENRDMRIIPIALPGAPADLNIPEFLRSRQVVDFREPNEWAYHQLRRAIVGAKPGRKDHFLTYEMPRTSSPQRQSRLRIVEWAIKDLRSRYEISCRTANTHGSQTIVIKTVFVRTHKVERHPIEDSLPVYLRPIGQIRIPARLPVPLTRKSIYWTLDTQTFLAPGEVEDIIIPLSIEEGWRAVISFGVHWLIVDEPRYRLVETGYAAIGQRGSPPDDDGMVPPSLARDTYHPGQHNLDNPQVLYTPDWPPGWPNEVSAAEWEHYGAGERPTS